MGERVIIKEIEDHMGNHGMWGGSIHPEKIKDMYGITSDNKLVLIENLHIPVMLKCIDEIIANATDHWKELSNKYPVTEIRVDIDENGLISVFNDGPGIPVVIHKQGNNNQKLKERGRDIYVPEVIFTVPLAGSSESDRTDGKEKGVVKAGVNSLGAKLCNVHSSLFIVETSDSTVCKKYRQQCDGIKVVHNPIITDYTDEEKKNPNKHSYTKITFMLNGMKTPQIAKDIALWMRYRTYLSAIYTGIKVTFNGVLCPNTPRKFIESIFTCTNAHIEETRVVAAEAPHSFHPWKVSVIIFNSPADIPKFGNAKIKTITIVNGVITLKGSHVDHIYDKILEEVEHKLKEKKVSLAELTSNMLLVMSCPIVDADWSGQNKEKLAVKQEVIDKYVIDPNFIKRVAVLALKPYFDKLDSAKNKVKPSEKYQSARYAGTKKYSQECSLFLAEGDSAIGMINKGLNINSRKPEGPNRDFYGIFSLQGVILNVAREMLTVETETGTVYLKNSKIRDNDRLNQLRLALNLNYDCKYETEDEIKTLHYGKIILCTDEDLDGVGKIAPLLLVYLYYFWPALFDNKMVYRMKTPLIRARKGDQLLEFYTEEEFKEAHCEGYAISYYKGLAANEDSDVANMFLLKNFKKNIYRYDIVDKVECKNLFNVYFGDDPSLRKIALSTPLTSFPIEEIKHYKKNQIIDVCKEQLNYSTKAYKKDAIIRQIPHICDGLNITRRKIVMTARMNGILPVDSSTKNLKVFQFAADVARRTYYHHGDASINSTVKYLSQGFYNHRLYPLLTRSGDFGDRHGLKGGEARYIGVKNSPLTTLLFPTKDDNLLTYMEDEGNIVEPSNYVSIMPFHILESSNSVSEGWANKTYGRAMDGVLKVINDYINNDEVLLTLEKELLAVFDPAVPYDEEARNAILGKLNEIYSETDKSKKYYMPPNTRGFVGEMRVIEDTIYSFGVYKIVGNVIVVSELPIGVLTNNYYESFILPSKVDEKEVPNPRMELIDTIFPNNDENSVNIEITLKKDAMEKIESTFGDKTERKRFTPMEHFLKIYASMGNSNLNYYSPEDTILEFGKNYLAALLYWIHYRKDLYMRRILRGKAIVELKIELLENIMRYLTEYERLKITESTSDDVSAKILDSAKYVKLNESFINNPELTEIEKIKDIAHNTGNYDYLTKLGCPRDFYAETAKKRETLMVRLKAELNKLNASLAESPVAKTEWLEEIKAFCDKVEIGIKNNFLSFIDKKDK